MILKFYVIPSGYMYIYIYIYVITFDKDTC